MFTSTRRRAKCILSNARNGEATRGEACYVKHATSLSGLADNRAPLQASISLVEIMTMIA